jgi:hypothetical protein
MISVRRLEVGATAVVIGAAAAVIFGLFELVADLDTAVRLLALIAAIGGAAIFVILFFVLQTPPTWGRSRAFSVVASVALVVGVGSVPLWSLFPEPVQALLLAFLAGCLLAIAVAFISRLAR